VRTDKTNTTKIICSNGHPPAVVFFIAINYQANIVIVIIGFSDNVGRKILSHSES
jgi:hypothetical protein